MILLVLIAAVVGCHVGDSVAPNDLARYYEQSGSLLDCPTNATESMWIVDIGVDLDSLPIFDVLVWNPHVAADYTVPNWHVTDSIVVMGVEYRGVVISARWGSIHGYNYLIRWYYP